MVFYSILIILRVFQIEGVLVGDGGNGGRSMVERDGGLETVSCHHFISTRKQSDLSSRTAVEYVRGLMAKLLLRDRGGGG